MLKLVVATALFAAAQSQLCSDCWYQSSTNYFNNAGTSCGASAKGLTNTLTTCTASTCSDVESPSNGTSTAIDLTAGSYCTFTINLAEVTTENVTASGFYFTGGFQGFCWENAPDADSTQTTVVSTRAGVETTTVSAIDITSASSSDSLIDTGVDATSYFC